MRHATVAGTLGSLVANAVGAGTVVVTLAGVLAGLAYAAAHVEIARRVFGPRRLEVRFPTTE